MHNGNTEWHVQDKWNYDKIKSENISKRTENGMVRTNIEDKYRIQEEYVVLYLLEMTAWKRLDN